jgi:tetratricopeptide (TPR) repeat protein
MPPAPAMPRHPEFIYPAVPEGTDAIQVTRIERGWRYLQSDDARPAEREFAAALQQQPSFHPAETGLGYVELAERNAKNAVERFERALRSAAAYTPALIGRGQALLELGRDGEALASFEDAVEADPSLTDLQSRIAVLRFRAVQDNLVRAKTASDAGRLAEARVAYQQAIAASPDSAFLYRDLAAVERRSGEVALALEHFRRAVALDPSDARSHAQIGAILEEQGDAAGALGAYETARAIDPAEAPAERIARLRENAALARLPAEYRAIPASETATRGDVAAVIGVRLDALLASTRPRQVVVTDIRNHWAQPWILTAVRAGVMDTQPNYTFQPGARVRRGDLALVVSRVLGLIATLHPTRARWLSARVTIADLATGHLSYPAVSQAVASGVMTLDAAGAFQLLRPVTGAEVVDAVARLEALARP